MSSRRWTVPIRDKHGQLTGETVTAITRAPFQIMTDWHRVGGCSLWVHHDDAIKMNPEHTLAIDQARRVPTETTKERDQA